MNAADSFYGHGAPLIELGPEAFTAEPAESRIRVRRIDGVLVRCNPETGQPL